MKLVFCLSTCLVFLLVQESQAFKCAVGYFNLMDGFTAYTPTAAPLLNTVSPPQVAFMDCITNLCFTAMSNVNATTNVVTGYISGCVGIQYSDPFTTYMVQASECYNPAPKPFTFNYAPNAQLMQRSFTGFVQCYKAGSSVPVASKLLLVVYPMGLLLTIFSFY